MVTRLVQAPNDRRLPPHVHRHRPHRELTPMQARNIDMHVFSVSGARLSE